MQYHARAVVDGRAQGSQRFVHLAFVVVAAQFDLRAATGIDALAGHEQVAPDGFARVGKGAGQGFDEGHLHGRGFASGLNRGRFSGQSRARQGGAGGQSQQVLQQGAAGRMRHGGAPWMMKKTGMLGAG